MVELSTPDRRVAGSIPVRVNSFFFFYSSAKTTREGMLHRKKDLIYG